VTPMENTTTLEINGGGINFKIEVLKEEDFNLFNQVLDEIRFRAEMISQIQVNGETKSWGEVREELFDQKFPEQKDAEGEASE